jgi:hypothetical protein
VLCACVCLCALGEMEGGWGLRRAVAMAANGCVTLNEAEAEVEAVVVGEGL